MPIENLIQHWHVQQRHNRKVSNNLRRLNTLSEKAKSVEEILAALHHWPLATTLRFKNRFSYLYLATSLLLMLFSYLYCTGIWLIICGLLAVAMAGYGFLSIEKQSEVDAVIQRLAGRMFELKYAVEFHHVPQGVSLSAISNQHLISQLRLNFPHLNQGTTFNAIEYYARTSWRIDDKVYPVLLLKYNYSSVPQDELKILQSNNQQQWGACVFKQPAYHLAISSRPQDYEDFPIAWQSSDIAFNQQFYIYGQSQLELVKELTPQRTLALAEHLQLMRGTLVFDDQLHAMCYLSSQNIFMSQSEFEQIDSITDLRGHLRTLKANLYLEMQQSLSQIIRSFAK